MVLSYERLQLNKKLAEKHVAQVIDENIGKKLKEKGWSLIGGLNDSIFYETKVWVYFS